MLATYRTSFAPIDASATASAKTWITTSLVPSLGVLAWRLLRIRITQASAPRSAVTCVNGHAAAAAAARLARHPRAGCGPVLAVDLPGPVRVDERRVVAATAAEDPPRPRAPPGVPVRPPRRLERIAPEVRRRERERIEELDL